MKYYVIAGERSGDLHASHLMKAIKKGDAEAEFRFWGGDAMAAVGGTMVKHYRETAFMGFWEVITHLRTIFGFIRECKEDILTYRPDVVILVDYAAFNLRIAKFIKKEGLPIQTYYYISPKVWAWNTKRAYKIKEVIDRMFVIFPFEVDFYRKFGYEVDFVGNPLLDAMAEFRPNLEFRQKNQLPGDKALIALLPGSRKQELVSNLNNMLVVLDKFPEYHFVIAGVGNLPKALYEPFLNRKGLSVVYDQTYDLLAEAEAAVVTSGTATLETALFEVPQVVVYRTGEFNAMVVRMVIKVKYIALANLILAKEVVRELLQGDFNPKNLEKELKAIIKGGSKRVRILEDYQVLKSKMGEPGASEKAGRMMLAYLKEHKGEALKE